MAQHAEPVDARQQQVEHDEVVVLVAQAAERLRAVRGAVDRESLSTESTRHERENPGLVFNDQNPQGPASDAGA